MASVLKPCKKCGTPFIGKYCKPCDNARSAARRAADPKKAAELVAAWKKSHPDRVRELNKLSYERNKEAIAARAKVFRKVHRKRLDEYNRAYEAEHPEVRRKIELNSGRKKVRELQDVYVRKLFGLPGVDIPKDLIDAKRVSIQIKRQLKGKI